MNNFVLTKYKNRWAILDLKSNVYYFGSKKNLEERIKELNKEQKIPVLMECGHAVDDDCLCR